MAVSTAAVGTEAAATVDPVAAQGNQGAAPQLADRLFRVEWTAGASSQGQTWIVGHVYNESEHDAAMSSFGSANSTRRVARSAAGFEMKLADTPEKLANLSTLTPRRTLIPRSATTGCTSSQLNALAWNLWAPWPWF